MESLVADLEAGGARGRHTLTKKSLNEIPSVIRPVGVPSGSDSEGLAGAGTTDVYSNRGTEDV